LTATPARPVFFQYAGRTRRDSLTDLDRPRRDAASPTRPRRPRKALSGPDRCVIGVLSFQNPDNATVDDEGPSRQWTRGRCNSGRGAARWAQAPRAAAGAPTPSDTRPPAQRERPGGGARENTRVKRPKGTLRRWHPRRTPR